VAASGPDTGAVSSDLAGCARSQRPPDAKIPAAPAEANVGIRRGDRLGLTHEYSQVACGDGITGTHMFERVCGVTGTAAEAEGEPGEVLDPARRGHDAAGVRVYPRRSAGHDPGRPQDIPGAWMSSRSVDFLAGGQGPGGGLVVESAGFQAAVQDADEPVGELAESGVVADFAGFLPVRS